MQGYKGGDKAKVAGDSVKDLGISSQSRIEGGTKMKLRGETSLATQRPTLAKSKVSSDRGSFTCK